jgi:hypothetical protein
MIFKLMEQSTERRANSNQRRELFHRTALAKLLR